MPYTPDPLLDDEVNEAFQRDEPRIIWEMVGTLATMDEAEWQVHRAAIKAHFGARINMSGLDKARAEKRNAAPGRPVEVESDKSGWEEKLHVSKSGSPQKVLINADIALRHAPEWAGVFAFDSFKSAIMVVGPPPIGGDFPRVWADEDNTRTAVWLQDHGIYVGPDTVATVVASIASDNPRHAVREYLAGLTWDQDPRVDGWLTRYLGVERSEYSIQVGRMWLISAIARVMQPGCKADYMLVLEGDQGKKKSTVLEILTSQPWFCDHTPDIHSKDAQGQVAGSWIMEWAELDTLSRSEITSVKAFITRRVEKFRPSYGRYTVEVPRQCVFAGTTNRQDWQRDETGGRRFWPVWCHEADLPGITADRDQLWAEAAYLYASGAKWWPDDEASHARIGAEQAARLEADPWQDKIAEFVAVMDQVTVSLILTNCIGLDIARHGQAEKNRVGRALRSIGWKYSGWRDKDETRIIKGFVKP